jgi:glycerophosphoryl diester phosphodiesterase
MELRVETRHKDAACNRRGMPRLYSIFTVIKLDKKGNNMTKWIITFLFLCLAGEELSGQTARTPDRIDSLLVRLSDPSDDYIFVVAHRGDWRNAPENSLEAVRRAIDMGVDMVEVDIRLTKDSVLVLMHDASIDRTTNGKGNIANFTLDELRQFRLKDALGTTLSQQIPTLKEVMTLCKNKTLVNVDKAGNYMDLVRQILKETGTERQVVYKGEQTYGQIRERYGKLLDSIIYMPMILSEREDMESYIADFLEYYHPKAFELSYKSVNSPIYSQIKRLKKAGCRVWTNSLWSSNNAGHDDERAVHNPDANWGWMIEQGTNLIQTDRPKELLEYLGRRK